MSGQKNEISLEGEKSFLLELSKLQFNGNIIDNGWIENLKYENGKPNMNAIFILSEIVYWYRPVEIRDELTGNFIGWKKKFKADKLQKNYQALGDRFGLTKRQAKLACDYLKDKDLIDIEFRTIVVNNTKINNVMYIGLNIINLKKITGIDRIYEEKTPTPITTECNTLLQQNVTGSYNRMQEPPTIGCKTNTKNTTEITTEINKKSKPKKDTPSEQDESPQNNFSFLEEDIELIFNFYKEVFKGTYTRISLTTQRKAAIAARLHKYSNEDIMKAIYNIRQNTWYCGENETGKVIADIKYICKDDTTLEEWINYKPENRKHKGKTTFHNHEQRDYDYDKLEPMLLGHVEYNEKEIIQGPGSGLKIIQEYLEKSKQEEVQV